MEEYVPASTPINKANVNQRNETPPNKRIGSKTNTTVNEVFMDLTTVCIME